MCVYYWPCIRDAAALSYVVAARVTVTINNVTLLIIDLCTWRWFRRILNQISECDVWIHLIDSSQIKEKMKRKATALLIW